MRTLWPNLDGDDGLETVLEVPVPDEMFASDSNSIKPWRAVKSWLMTGRTPRPSPDYEARALEIQSLLGVVAAPLLPLPISSNHDIKSHPIVSLDIITYILSLELLLLLFYHLSTFSNSPDEVCTMFSVYIRLHPIFFFLGN